MIFHTLQLLVLFLPWATVQSFVAPASTISRFFQISNGQSNTPTSLQGKTTLDEETTWRLRFVLDGTPTEQGQKVSGMVFAVDVHFIEEIGYEPPQGELKQIFADGNSTADTQFKITSSRWQLSEDPNERKDGLWVWGLFQEPLYPFLLLRIETDAVPLPNSEDSIPPLKLFAQINHKRDKEEGVLLSGAELKIRVVETMKADPFGAAKVDIYEEVSVGQLSILPVQ